MKRTILAAVLAFGFMSYAAVDTQTPTGDQITFDVEVKLSVCTLDQNGDVSECKGTDSPTPIKETMSAELIHSECRPKCTFNDSASFDKDYTLKDPSSGKEVSAHLSVWFSRQSELFNDTVPTFDIQTSLSPTGGKDTRDALISVKDLSALNDILVNSKAINKKLDNGKTYQLQPYAIVKSFQISKKQ